jgi:ABC-type nitrate/sulfonate/bicarbonate transport system substrate-binding protein
MRDFDERLDYYTPVMITSNSMIDENPDAIKKFLAASKKGYEFCIESPDEAAQILHKNADTYDLGMLKESQNYLTDKYIDDAEYWGVMKDEPWDRYNEFMVENGLIKKELKAEDCYTNEFLTE